MKRDSFRITLPAEDAELLHQAVCANWHSLPNIRGSNSHTTFFAKAAIVQAAKIATKTNTPLHWYGIEPELNKQIEAACKRHFLSPLLFVRQVVIDSLDDLDGTRSEMVYYYRERERQFLRAAATRLSPSGNICKTEFGGQPGQPPEQPPA